jgi:hypothetical protein
MADVDARAVLSLLRRGVMFEVRLYLSLFRWVTRRPVTPSPQVHAFGYTRDVTPLLWLWIFASAIEIPFLHLLIPWPTVRIVALVLGGWGVAWMIGFLATLKVHPHLLSDYALRVRSGHSTDITIPFEAIATIAVQRRDLPSSSRTLQPRETSSGMDLQVSVSGQVNVHVVLRQPTTVPTPKGSMEITELSFLADDAQALVSRARSRLSAGVQAEGADDASRRRAVTRPFRSAL